MMDLLNVLELREDVSLFNKDINERIKCFKDELYSKYPNVRVSFEIKTEEIMISDKVPSIKIQYLDFAINVI